MLAIEGSSCRQLVGFRIQHATARPKAVPVCKSLTARSRTNRDSQVLLRRVCVPSRDAATTLRGHSWSSYVHGNRAPWLFCDGSVGKSAWAFEYSSPSSGNIYCANVEYNGFNHLRANLCFGSQSRGCPIQPSFDRVGIFLNEQPPPYKARFLLSFFLKEKVVLFPRLRSLQPSCDKYRPSAL